MTKYNKIVDGDWETPRMTGYKLMCCDCELVHIINFRVINKKTIQLQAFRDNRSTGQSRRYCKGEIKLKTGNRKISISREKVKKSVETVINQTKDQ